MDEGNPAAAGALAGDLVHETVSRPAAPLECGVEVGHPVADMMDAGATPLEEPGNRAGGITRREQLDFRLAERKGQDVGAVGRFRGVRLDAEYLPVEGGGDVEIGNGNADMRDARGFGHSSLLNQWPDGPADLFNAAAQGRNDRENISMTATNTQIAHVTDATFAAEVEQASGLVLVDFWATWCGPCQVIAPILEQLASQHAGKVKIAKLDVDSNQQTTLRFNVRSIPSILFFRDGRHVDTVVGAVPKGTLEQRIQQHLA